MFAACGFLLGCVGQEFWRGARARRAMSGEALPVALVSLVRRNRRRYGGYLVHAAWRCCSSASPRRRRSST